MLYTLDSLANGLNSLSIFSALSVDAFPSLPEDFSLQAFSDKEWGHFLFSCANEAGVAALVTVALVGELAVLAVLLRSCRCRCRGVRHAVQPRGICFLCVGCLTLTLLPVVILVGFRDISTMVQLRQSAISGMTALLESQHDVGEGLLQAMSVIDNCDDKPALAEQLAPIRPLLQACVDGYRYAAGGGDGVDGSLVPRLYVLGIPLVLVLLCCAHLFLSVCTTRRDTGRRRCCCSRFCVRSLGLLIILPLILVVAVLSTVELGLGLAVASFCRRPDDNILTFINHQFHDEFIDQVSRYYVKGDSEANPLALRFPAEEVGEDNPSARRLSAEADTEDGMTSVDKDQCHHALADISSKLSTYAKSVPDRKAFQEVYMQFFGRDACETCVGMLGRLVASQFTTGLVLLPLLTCLAYSFFDKWVAWERQSGRPDANNGIELTRLSGENLLGVGASGRASGAAAARARANR